MATRSMLTGEDERFNKLHRQTTYHRADGVTFYEQGETERRHNVRNVELFHDVWSRRCVYSGPNVDGEPVKSSNVGLWDPRRRHNYSRQQNNLG